MWKNGHARHEGRPERLLGFECSSGSNAPSRAGRGGAERECLRVGKVLPEFGQGPLCDRLRAACTAPARLRNNIQAGDYQRGTTFSSQHLNRMQGGYPLSHPMSFWQGCLNNFMSDGLCWDAAIVSISELQLLGAHAGGALARLTKPEIQALLGKNRRALLTQGLTLGGLKCLVIRDNLYTDAHQYTMDLRTKLYRDHEGCYTRAVTVLLVNPVCLIFIGEKGIQGGTLNMKAFEIAQYIRDKLHQ